MTRGTLVRLLRFLSLAVLVPGVGGCALLGDPPPAQGCPPVYIVREMSTLPTAAFTARLRGVRDVTCTWEGDRLHVRAALVTGLAVPARPAEALRLPVPLTVAAVAANGREVVSRRAVTRAVRFTPGDGTSATRRLSLAVRLERARDVRTVYVGLVGGRE